MRPFLIVILLILLSTFTFAQRKECDFSIDSVKIQRNENLQAFIDALQVTEFKTANKKKLIPKFIKRTLNCWTNDFDIANPGRRYQVTDVHIWTIKGLPRRQLTYLGLSDQNIVMTYKKGGFAKGNNILLFKFVNKKITDFWAGGNADVDSKEEVLYFLTHHRDMLQSSNIEL
jgi:hypothetical protein